MYQLAFDEGWDEHYNKLDKNHKEKIWKKIEQLECLQKARHMKHGLPFFVVEAGQYRICYEQEETKRIIRFAGSHKQYEKWYKDQ